MGIGLYYIDDSLLLHDTKDGCLFFTKLLCQMLMELEFTVKEEKSPLNPEQSIEFLGYTLCSNSMSI